MADELIDVMDARGETIGQATRAEIDARKLFHRAAGVIVVNSKGELLVHRRSMAADNPGKYAIFVCTTLHAGETYVPAAARIVREKLRLVRKDQSVNLRAIFPYNFRSAEANINFGMFRCVYDGVLKPNPVDIGEHFFTPIVEVEKLMGEKPFLKSSVEIFRKYREGSRQ